MAEQPAASDERALKQRAMRRLALALVLIVAAIVGLGLLDHYAGRKRTATPEAPPTEPPPIATLPQPQVERSTPATEAPAAQPSPALPPPPPPSVEERITASPSSAASSAPEPAAGTAHTSSGASRATRAAPPAGKPGIPVQSTVAPSASGPVSTLEAREGFVVQLGVFTTVENAQALQAKLKEQGIPVFLETRVVVGPFRDRAEAEAAYRKLKALGVGGVIVQRK